MFDSRDPDEILEVQVTDEERSLLDTGLHVWGAAANHPTDAFARAMGFANVRDICREATRIGDDLRSGRPLTRRDWTRALLATEIGFASEVVGAGTDWIADAEWDDEQTLRMLRNLQWKLAEFVLRRGAWETHDRDWR